MTSSKIFNKLCVSFCDKNVATWLQQFPDILFAEARLDLMRPNYQEIQEIFSHPIRWMATCPSCEIPDDERLKLLCQAIESGAKIVDIAINESTTFFNTIQSVAKKHDCKILISHHDFEQSIDYETLVSIITHCFTLQPDFVKIAYFIHHKSDIENIEKLYQQFHQIIIIGMGEQNADIRMKILDWGAPFTFVAPQTNKKTAPGQYTFENAVTFLRKKYN